MARADCATVLDPLVMSPTRTAVSIRPDAASAIPLLFEGVLFNRHELIELLAPDRPSPDDRELVALAYRRWQDDFAQWLKGQFAVVVWDRSRQTWLAARDAIGVHPLFYSCSGREAVFGSSMEGVLAHPSVRGTLNRVALVDYLCHRWPDPGETYYAAIRRVPTGSIVISRAGAVSARRYWDPVPQGHRVQWVDPVDALDEFQRLFVQAVDRAVGRGRSAIFLSGGLDSVSVAAAAAERAPMSGHLAPLALSLAFPHPDCDESEVQARVARQLGLQQDLLPMEDAVGPDGLLEDTLEMTASWPTLLLNTWAPAYARLATRGRAAGVEVILTGNGGDEWLSVSPYLAADLIRAGEVRRLVSFVGSWQRSYRGTRPQALKQVLWTFGLRPLGSAALARVAPAAWHRSRWERLLRSSPPWVAPDPELRQAMRERTERALSRARPQNGFYWQEVRLGLEHALVSQELEELFEIGRRLGVEMQHPYWDADLVEMLCRTHPDVLNRGGRSKGLVRAAIEARFPRLGFGQQRKVPATRYSRQLLQHEGARAWRRLGGLRGLGELGVVDASAAQAAGERALAAGEPKEMFRTWELLKLETWVRARLN